MSRAKSCPLDPRSLSERHADKEGPPCKGSAFEKSHGGKTGGEVWGEDRAKHCFRARDALTARLAFEQKPS